MLQITIEEIFSKRNTAAAIEHLQKKNNSCGIDGVWAKDIAEYWEMNKEGIIDAINNFEYDTGVIREIEIIQPNGKRRNIAQMNTIDRFILRCITQIIQKKGDALFHDNSFAYREGRGVQAAVKQAIEYISKGNEWVAEIDVKNFFDNISHERMCEKLAEEIRNKPTLRLIESFIKVRVEQDFEIINKQTGLLQGNPLSPFLSNLYLDGLDRELEKQGLLAIRYCDNINIYTQSYEQALEAIGFVRDELKSNYDLELNEAKTSAHKALGRDYLGQVIEKSEKNKRIYAHRKVKEKRSVYRHWNKTAIQKIDKNYHLINDGILSKKDFSVLFENEEGKHLIPVEMTDSINIYSNVILNGDFLNFAAERKLNVNFYNKYGDFIGEYVAPAMRGSAKTLIKQTQMYLDDKTRLETAKTIIIAASHNMRSNIRYYKKKRKTNCLVEIERDLSNFIVEMNEAQSIEKLLLVEARSRQRYYQSFNEIVKNDDFGFTQRTKRPPKDAVNALISFGNVLLYNRIATEIYKSRLDIRIAYLHASNNRAESLNLDLAEIFKPLIVDRTIFSIINRGMISLEEHFEYNEKVDGIYMNRKGKEQFIRAVEDKIHQTINVEGQKISYGTLMSREVKKFQQYVEKGETYKAYKYY